MPSSLIPSLEPTYNLIIKGGWVMLPLLLSGLFALTILIERSLILYGRYNEKLIWIERIFQLLIKEDFEKIRLECQEKTSPTADLILESLKQMDSPLIELEKALEYRAESWIPHFEKHLNWLDTIITAAPLMGLLGTITGMMGSFSVLSEKGINDPTAITGGVAEALIATATGLLIALVSVFAFNALNNRVKSLIYLLENIAARLIQFKIERDHVQIKKRQTL